MTYGILVAFSGDDYHIIGEVDSMEEALNMASEYLVYGPKNDLPCPDGFVVNRRDSNGFYTIKETVAIAI